MLPAIGCAALLALPAPAPAPEWPGPEWLGPEWPGPEWPGPEWMEGPLEAALERARAEHRLVMVELWTSWSRDSARLREVLASEAVEPALEGYLCLTLDAESRTGAPLAYRQHVGAYPTLLFFEADGALRERLHGYLSAETLVGELERIARNEDTLAALRAALVAAPDDLERRYELALKLEQAGDAAGSAEELDQIRALDPEGTSRASRRMRFDEVHDAFYKDLVDWEELDWAGFEALALEVDDPSLEFRGLALLAFAHNIEALRARNAVEREPEREAEVQPHLRASRAFYARAWAIVPESKRALFGNELAYTFWEDRENLTEDERALALEVAERALELLPDEASVLDTAACCNFMNGNRERALELLARARELDPAGDTDWDEHEALFRGE
jgi:tetratricopeptide (TPR) repeat protein